MERGCPACGSSVLAHVADLGEMPVAVGLTFATEQLAMTSPRGRMRLAACAQCAHVINAAFDESLVEYDSSYEAALFHSPAYARYAAELVARLTASHGLTGRAVLEIGSSGGDFLSLLVAQGCRAFGADPAYSGVSEADGVTLLPGLVPQTGQRFDFIVARFVLEHLADPYSFLCQLRERAGDGGLGVYLEVPDASYDLSTAGWDCIYPHVGYFNDASLRALCERAGFSVLRSGTAFHEQYLWVEVQARPGAATEEMSRAEPGVRRMIETFADRYEDARRTWVERLDSLSATDARPVLWGAGTRGMMFCNRIDAGRRLCAVVDRNPAKHDRFLPVTGHRVVAPSALVALGPKTVIVTNPAYRDEIAAELAEQGLRVEVLVA